MRSYLNRDTRPVVAFYSHDYQRWYPFEWGDDDALTVGSDIADSIRLSHRSVSRAHCILERKDEGVVMREIVIRQPDGDSRPKNGTWVNGVRIRGECVLQHGNTVTLGRVPLVAAASVEELPTAEIVGMSLGHFVRNAISIIGNVARAARSVKIDRITLSRWTKRS